jgi:hypothetical protein
MVSINKVMPEIITAAARRYLSIVGLLKCLRYYKKLSAEIEEKKAGHKSPACNISSPEG